MNTTTTCTPVVSSVGLVDVWSTGEVDITPWVNENTRVRMREVDITVLSNLGHYGDPVILVLREPGNSDVWLGEAFAVEGD